MTTVLSPSMHPKKNLSYSRGVGWKREIETGLIIEIVEPYLDLLQKSQMDPTLFCFYYAVEISLIHNFRN